ncbi:HAUS augmin-like complex subunit 3 isoform X1 [Apus apus]|uniref:HAUS augmin-like complex subunit 3 isoform X1 n=1 Tax=Apus apus TaxID=8895 RepID=UPI0021F883B1|nr:HAUS augmin-like complex subunit 3 isoform X1 [Apus apus]XP_051475138.1 HAUS augmin-like complex subunit 3 isoform X1 [Apus apus]XP_051475139.1 HAUS augmin-like complex subunit 3 isoform X1 [Apus apus]
MSCGNDFVETLKKIGYPKADELDGEDFDWLFESSEEKSFLEWFCGNVSEQHVVSEKELQDFDSLLESGKPILEGNALDEVLKTLKPVGSKNSSQEEEEEEEELKKLEDELQTLKKLKKLQIHRQNKLQMMVAANSHVLQTFKSKEEEAHKYLKEGLEMFTAANNKLNSELVSLTDAAKKLSSFFTASDSEQGSGQHPVFFSQLSLDKYLSQEEQSTAALTSYIKKTTCFYQGMSEWVECCHEDSFQLGDTSKQGTCDETEEVCEESQEIARLQAAYISAQHQLIQMQAKEEGMKSAIKCAESMLQSLDNKDIRKQENLDAKISNLNDEISRLRQDITQINNKELLPLLKEKARLWSAPVVKGYLDHQIAQHEYYASRQEEICRHFIRQRASFELIELAYELELKKHKEVCCQVENLVESLKQSSNELQRRLQVITEQTQSAKPRNIISSNDGFSCRLYQLLEGENKKQQLFKTYKSLEQMAQKLKEDCTTVQDQLAASSQEQSLLLSKLKSDVDTLHDALYRGGNQIQLRSPELTEQFHQLEVDLKKLNQLLMDLIADVKLKRNFIESNKLHQMERNLYVYFFKDEDHLKEMVEKLEQQSEAKVSDLEDENITTSGVLNV